MRRRCGCRAVLAAGAALCTVVPLGGPATGEPLPYVPYVPYAFAKDARTVKGSPSGAGSAKLSPGATYRSSLARGDRLYYRLDLSADDTAYVSATAVPGRDAKVAYADGIKVSVEDAQNRTCGRSEALFGPSESPRPLTASAERRAGQGTLRCEGAGTHYVVVERISDAASTPAAWGLELHVASEPALVRRRGTTAPETWNSATPVPPDGARRHRAGGSSFNDARSLERGVWGDRVEPGQTLYYRVPVDWGQQVSATAELGGADGKGGRFAFVPDALTLSLYNPVRSLVTDEDAAYDGGQKSAALDPLPPVAYENRYGIGDKVTGMRCAGWYYLTVHLGREVAKKFGRQPLGLTLRVNVKGDGRPGPGYAGEPRPADAFEVTGRDREAAAAGEQPAEAGGPRASGGAGASGASGGESGTMKAVAVAGFGAGSVLLLVLGVWTVAGRRRAARAPRSW